MHVLLLAPKAGFFGGVEQHVFDIARGLTAAGHRCDLGFGRWTGRSDGLWRDSFRCFPVDELGAGAGEPLAALVERLRPEVVYGHKVEAIFPVLGRLPDAVRRLAMIHDHDLVCPRRHKYTAWTGRVCRRPMSMACVLDGAWLKRGESGFTLEPMAPKLASLRAAKRMDRLVVASRFMAEELVTNGCDPGRIVRLAPVPRRDPASRPPGAVGPAEGEETDLLFVGQLVRGKGVDLLLRALPSMARKARLTLVGDGNARADLEKLAARLGVAGRTRFVGWVDPERIGGFYRRAQVVVMPGRWPEPFGLVGQEAMARAKPVVAFDVGGVGDWLDDGRTGLLVPEQDLGQMAGALDRLLSDAALRRRLGRTARSRYRERFLFEPYLDQLVALLGSAGFGQVAA